MFFKQLMASLALGVLLINATGSVQADNTKKQMPWWNPCVWAGLTYLSVKSFNFGRQVLMPFKKLLPKKIFFPSIIGLTSLPAFTTYKTTKNGICYVRQNFRRITPEEYQATSNNQQQV